MARLGLIGWVRIRLDNGQTMCSADGVYFVTLT